MWGEGRDSARVRVLSPLGGRVPLSPRADEKTLCAGATSAPRGSKSSHIPLAPPCSTHLPGTRIGLTFHTGR